MNDLVWAKIQRRPTDMLLLRLQHSDDLVVGDEVGVCTPCGYEESLSSSGSFNASRLAISALAPRRTEDDLRDLRRPSM